ncbi:MAG: hypothetical protein QOE06_169 [Thermoleophilaceae bacterium]|jgi:hypothetical protein|nr:hypothetical protein [Thermoleophilaceae bacterium]
MRRATRRTSGSIAVLAAIVSLAAAAQASAGPPIESALADGCQRNPAGLLTFTSPSWALVGAHQRTDYMRRVEGSSLKVHTAGEDLPEAHASYDLDFNVKPDAAYLDLLAGTPQSHDGNWADDADRGELHVEWESGAMPTYAWPTEGDRVSVWGQWIWDCGHWGEGIVSDPDNPLGSLQHTGDYFLPGEIEQNLEGAPQTIRGEQTELHPMAGVVVSRLAPWQAVARESQTDAYFSSAGTQAYSTELCARDQQQNPASTYGPDFAACTQDPSRQYQPLAGRTFSFHVPAPPRPSPTAQLRYREVERVKGAGATEVVTPAADGLDVTVTFGADPVHAGQSFGKTYFVGWENDAGARPEHLQLELNSIRVIHSLDPNPGRPQQTGPPPGEYNLYIDVNGFWHFIGGRGAAGSVAPGVPDEWAPSLGAVTDGQEIAVGRKVDFFVPQGRGVRLDVSGRECDLPRMDPCVITAEVSDGNDQPGEKVQTYASAAAALGDHELGNDNYLLRYTVRRIADPAPGPSPPGSSGVPSSDPGGNLGGSGTVERPPQPSGCADTSPPSTAFDRARLAASRTAIVLRGSAGDSGCAGGVRRVSVAVAHHERGGRCRWLGADGRLGARQSCRAYTYFGAKGTASWVARLRGALPAGTWIARSRAIDRAGNVELKRRLSGRSRNFLKFTIR